VRTDAVALLVEDEEVGEVDQKRHLHAVAQGEVGGGADDEVAGRAGPVVTLDDPRDNEVRPPSAEPRLPGDLIVRTTPDLALRHGMQVPLLVDLAHLFVFDQQGDRICPHPARLPDLGE
jgi:multiple sugar transport system ATP-binding protein